MEETNDKSDSDSKRAKMASSSSSSSDSTSSISSDSSSSSSSSTSDIEEENNRPSGSGATTNFARFTVNKLRKRFKKRTCKQRKALKSEDGGSHRPHLNCDLAEPSSSIATFHKLKGRTKRRSYRRVTSDNEDEATEVAAPETPAAETAEKETAAKSSEDNSSTESEVHEKKGSDENSDEYTTTDEETQTIPLVLRKIKPKSTLSIVNEVMNRQIGHSKRFDKKLYGSLHMVERLRRLHSLDEHRGCVNTIEFSRKGDLLVSGSDDLAIIIWNWATGKKVRSYKSGHRNNIFQASWIPRDDLSLMVTCASDGQVRLIDLISGSTRQIAHHQGACNKFAIHPNIPHTVISVGDDGKMLSIDIRDGETTKLVTLMERESPVEIYSIHCNPRNENEFCVGCHSESIKIYDRRMATTPLSKLCPENLVDNERVFVTAVAYNYNGTELLASYNDDDIYLFDTLTSHPDGDYVHKYQGHRNSRTIKGVDFFGPKSEFIVSGSDCGHIYMWEKNTEAIVQCMPGDAQGVVNRVKAHPHVPVLATSGLDDDVKIWVPSGTQAPALSDLKQCVTTNIISRAEGRQQCRNYSDRDLFSMILGQIRQNRTLLSLLSERRLVTLFDMDDDDSDDD